MDLEFLKDLISPEIISVLKLLALVVLGGHFLFGVLVYRQVLRANTMIKSRGTGFIYVLVNIYVIMLAIIIVVMLSI